MRKKLSAYSLIEALISLSLSLLLISFLGLWMSQVLQFSHHRHEQALKTHRQQSLVAYLRQEIAHCQLTKWDAHEIVLSQQGQIIRWRLLGDGRIRRSTQGGLNDFTRPGDLPADLEFKKPSELLIQLGSYSFLIPSLKGMP